VSAAPQHWRRAALLGLLTLLVGCGGDHITGLVIVPSQGMIVSHPVPAPAGAAQPGATLSGALAAAADGDSVVYTSLVPGTAPTGVTATVRALTSGATVTTVIQDGGFDPIPLAAKVGDTVATVAFDASGAVVFTAEAAVIPIRRIKVVRTDPAPEKRDQPLNANIVIVFSDPVDVATLTTSSLQLLRGTAPVAGAVRLLPGSPTTAVFTPSAPLDPNTDYRLVVTTEVRDVTGGDLDASASISFRTGTRMVGPATMVTLFPDTAALAVGWQGQLNAVARDSFLNIIVGRPFSWSSDDPTVATVSPGGLVTALAEGVAHVQAQMDRAYAVTTIKVSVVLAPVASVEVVPGSAKVVVGGLVQLTAVLRDAAGNRLRFRDITWQSGNPAVATVSAGTGGTAVVTDVAAGTVTITAISEGSGGTATIRTGTVGPYTQIATSDHTCGLAADGSAWCWGGGIPGGLGNGTQSDVLVPVAVAGSLRFSQLSSTCALTSDGLAYCWGDNSVGQLGDGTNAGSSVPVAVSGGRQYVSIGVGGRHACALTSNGAAYCWGSNESGALGLGTTTISESAVPVPVSGGLAFTSLAVGAGHTCGLTTSGFTYCWGTGGAGALGNGSLIDQFAPVLALGPVFVTIDAGEAHTCGLTVDGSAYCWGENDDGRLGVGTTTGPESPCLDAGSCSTVPVQVTGGLRFSQISAGSQHTCAVASTGTAYCWGANYSAQLGNGSTGSVVPAPVAVAGGLAFASVSAGGYSCAITRAGVVYCWGGGGLGNGSTDGSNVPVRVAGQP